MSPSPKEPKNVFLCCGKARRGEARRGEERRGEMTFYVENYKDSSKQLLELTDELSGAAGCKVNTQKSIVFLCPNDEPSEREMKKTIPFSITTKRIKYLGIHLTKEVKEPPLKITTH